MDALDALARSTPADAPRKPRRTLTRAQIARLICAGHVLVLSRRTVYRLNAWLAAHPGGALAILHFVGRDAADELAAYHPPATLARMRLFAVAEVDARDWSETEGWRPVTPPVQLGWPDRAPAYARVPPISDALLAELDALDSLHTPLLTPASVEPPAPPPGLDPAEQHALSLAYHRLHADLTARGHYAPMPVWRYRFELVRYALLFAAFLVVFRRATATWHVALSAAFFGFFWHQVTFVAHDLGHTGVTGSYKADRVLGTILANLVGGLSIGWWADNHNIHHLVTNHPEHDPDIQHLPFFAISPRFLTDNLFSTYYRRLLTFDKPARFFVQLQCVVARP